MSLATPSAPTKPPFLGQRLGMGWTVVLLAVAAVILVGMARSLQDAMRPDYETTVHWAVGSADISGRLSNNTDRGCSYPRVHLVERDHNGAVIYEDDFKPAEVAARSSIEWHYRRLSFLGDQAPVGTRTSAMSGEATCDDRV